MNHKIVVQFALLAVVGASIGAWAWNSFARDVPAAPSITAPNGSAGDLQPAPAASPMPVAREAAKVLADGVAVINFHGTRR